MHADGLASGSTTVAYVSTSTISKLLPPSLSSTELPGAVAIYGSWLASASCDGKVLPLSTSWAAEYSCTIDPVSVGFTTVSTITRGQTLSVSYLIKKTPLLLNVNPSGATTLPDEIITLSTQHFIGDDDQFHCLFDAEKSVVPHIISSGLVRCESIATTKVSTQLTIEGGDGVPLSQGVPSASTVSPQTSGGIGGTLITITGTNIPIIDNSAVCSFGSIGPISSQSSHQRKSRMLSQAGSDEYKCNHLCECLQCAFTVEKLHFDAHLLRWFDRATDRFGQWNRKQKGVDIYRFGEMRCRTPWFPRCRQSKLVERMLHSHPLLVEYTSYHSSLVVSNLYLRLQTSEESPSLR